MIYLAILGESLTLLPPIFLWVTAETASDDRLHSTISCFSTGGRTVKRTYGIFWGQKEVIRDADELLFSDQLAHDTAQLAL